MHLKIKKEGNFLKLICSEGFLKKTSSYLIGTDLSFFYERNVFIITHIDAKTQYHAEILLGLLIDYFSTIGNFIISTGRFLTDEFIFIDAFYKKGFEEKEVIQEFSLNLEDFFVWKKQMDIKIYPLLEIDLEILYQLFNQIFPEKLSKEGIKSLLENPKLIKKSCLYISNDKPIGFIIVEASGRKVLLNYIGVLKEHRRRGYGSFLLRNSLHILKQEGFLEIVAYVSSLNKIATAFFKRINFIPTKSIKRLERHII